MSLDRWLAFLILIAFAIYGYTAFFLMDDLLPPIVKRNPIWPSSFPKILAVGGVVCALVVLLGFEKSSSPEASDINYRRLPANNLLQAFTLLGLMVAYALLLRPLGFLAATFLFLLLGSTVLGERRHLIAALISVVFTLGVWYLVQKVLGIYLNPLPFFL